MSHLEELQIRKDYYKAKYLYIELKIKKLMKASTEPQLIKSFIGDTITIQPDSENEEEEEESEEEPETDISLFFNTQIIRDENAKIKRSDCYNRYAKYCESQQLKPKIKSVFFEDIEAFLGKPTKSNVYCYKNYKFIEPDTQLSFNETIEDLIF